MRYDDRVHLQQARLEILRALADITRANTARRARPISCTPLHRALDALDVVIAHAREVASA